MREINPEKKSVEDMKRWDFVKYWEVLKTKGRQNSTEFTKNLKLTCRSRSGQKVEVQRIQQREADPERDREKVQLGQELEKQDKGQKNFE